MKPQPIATAPRGTDILGWTPSHTSWMVGNIDDLGTFYAYPTASAYHNITHWLPLPEPPMPKQAYMFLEEGDRIQEGDEYYYPPTDEWKPFTDEVVGADLADGMYPIRRKIPTPNPES